MKILLVNPPLKNLIQAETPKFVTKDRGHNPPLGIISIASCVNKFTNHAAEVLDTQVEELSLDEIKARIKKSAPDVVGMAAHTFTLLDSLYLAELVKGINPEIKVLLGGPHATMFPRESIHHPQVDFVLTGEGEKTVPELLDAIGNDEKLKKVRGMVFRDETGRVISTGPPEQIEDLDTLPVTDMKLVPYMRYSSLLAKKNPLTTMVTSRGCPYRCTFCDRPQMGGKTFRARSAKLVVDEMEINKGLGINEILFYDDTFTLDKERTFDICNEIIRRKLDIVWDVRTRADSVNLEMLKLMKKAGCHRINFGVESGTSEGLSIVKKDVSLEKLEQTFKMTKAVGLDVLGYFMLGLPGETKAMMHQTIGFAKKLDPSFAHFTVFTPFPQTEVWRDLLAKGDNSVANAWKEYALNPTTAFDPPTCNEYLTKKELFEMAQIAYKEFYFRPNYIMRELLKVKSLGEFVKKTKAGVKMLLAEA